MIRVADAFAGESRRIRWLQALVLIFSAAVVGALLWFLCIAIDKGFNGHLKSTEQILLGSAKELVTAGGASASSPEKVEPKPKARVGGIKSEVKHAEPAASAASAAGDSSLHELLSTGVKAIASTTVAVIWVLVIAITVITISIARAVLSLKPQGLEGSADGEKDGKSDNSAAITLPGLEFAKEVLKLMGETAKSVGKS